MQGQPLLVYPVPRAILQSGPWPLVHAHLDLIDARRGFVDQDRVDDRCVVGIGQVRDAFVLLGFSPAIGVPAVRGDPLEVLGDHHGSIAKYRIVHAVRSYGLLDESLPGGLCIRAGARVGKVRLLGASGDEA